MSIQLPETYLSKMKTLLKEEYEAYVNSFEEERSYGLRVNTSKISVEEFLKISPFELEPIPWISDGFYYKEEDHPGKHPYYYAGLYYLQDPSAMTPAEILPVEPGDFVLDTCAAPGGKSTKLANKLQGNGLLFANDISISRCNALLKNLERNGSANIYVSSEDTSKLAAHFQGCFDKILVDAPCSGEGMFRKEPSLIRTWLEKGNAYYAELQKQIASEAVEMLKEGGMMVYSTCTFAPEEDEKVIEYLLDRYDLEVLPIENRYEGFAGGITERTGNCIRLYPHKLKGEGHFCALLRKRSGITTKREKTERQNIPQVFTDTMAKFTIDLSGKKIESIQEKLYATVPFVSTKGIRLVRSGLYLGDMKNKRFEPSQALAMSLAKENTDRVVNFSADDIRTRKYLKGETVSVPEYEWKGLVLVTVDGFPLGFGQMQGTQLKNKLAKGWIMH